MVVQQLRILLGDREGELEQERVAAPLLGQRGQQGCRPARAAGELVLLLRGQRAQQAEVLMVDRAGAVLEERCALARGDRKHEPDPVGGA